MGNAILLSNNRLDYISIITLSSGINPLALYDRDKNTQWSSVGSNDTIIEVITIDLGKVKVFDRLLILNHNLKKFQLTKTDDTVIVEMLDSAELQNFLTFELQNLPTVKLKCWTTQIANQEKKIGELLLMEHYYTLTQNPTTMSAKYREQAGDVELADGTLKQWKISGSERWGEDYEFDGINKAMIDNLKDLKTTYYRHPFFVYPFPDERPDDIYLCNWTNAFEMEVQQAWEEGERLFNLRMELREV